TIFHDAEVQGYAAAIAKHGRFRHNRVPIAPHCRDDATHVVAEVNAFRGRQYLITVSKCTARPLLSVRTTVKSAAGFRHWTAVQARTPTRSIGVLASVTNRVLK